jgi:hypothetical protein
MDEAGKRQWDVWLGIVAPILTVAGILVGVWQFNRGENNRVKLENELVIKKDTVEFQRKLWLNRLETYKAMITLAGNIVAAAEDKKTGDAAFDQLWRDLTASYWSQSIFVEDDDVAGPLRDFYTAVRDLRGGWTGADEVKLHANALVQACRASITRDAPLGAKP